MQRKVCIPPRKKQKSGGGREFGSIFAAFVPLASQNPYPITEASYRPHRSLLSNCNFRTPKLVTFWLCIYHTKPFKKESTT